MLSNGVETSPEASSKNPAGMKTHSCQVYADVCGVISCIRSRIYLLYHLIYWQKPLYNKLLESWWLKRAITNSHLSWVPWGWLIQAGLGWGSSVPHVSPSRPCIQWSNEGFSHDKARSEITPTEAPTNSGGLSSAVAHCYFCLILPKRES